MRLLWECIEAVVLASGVLARGLKRFSRSSAEARLCHDSPQSRHRGARPSGYAASDNLVKQKGDDDRFIWQTPHSHSDPIAIGT